MFIGLGQLGEARVDKAARDAHLCDLMRCPSLGAAFTAQQLLRPIKKKSVNPRVYIARLQLLASMVTEAGIQPESKEGLPLDPTVQLAMDWFGNANADVRENAVKLVAACYAHAGMRRIEKYLANIRQAQREIFDEEFDRVDAGDGLQLAQPSHRSAGSNRSTPKGTGRSELQSTVDDVDVASIGVLFESPNSFDLLWTYCLWTVFCMSPNCTICWD
ncbi:unnamed protein product [Durusdinium trenchii]|uniref:Uncharacterized protein n=1 Tax=Durusdinium trenchii TaxID=1381693 RepID=A0ABP0MFA6_9DINO